MGGEVLSNDWRKFRDFQVVSVEQVEDAADEVWFKFYLLYYFNHCPGYIRKCGEKLASKLIFGHFVLWLTFCSL